MSLPRQKIQPYQTIDHEKQIPEEQYENPIVRANRAALPKIYGVRHHKKYSNLKQSYRAHLFLTKVKNNEILLSNRRNKVYYCSLEEIKEFDEKSSRKYNQIRGVENISKKHDKARDSVLSRPKQQFCSKRYCLCNKLHHERSIQTIKESKKNIQNITYSFNEVIKKRPNIGKIVKLPGMKKYSTIAVNTEELLQSQIHQFKQSIMVQDILADGERSHKTQHRKSNKNYQSQNQSLRMQVQRDGLGSLMKYKHFSQRLYTEPVIEQQERSSGEVSERVNTNAQIRQSHLSKKTNKRSKSPMKNIAINIYPSDREILKSPNQTVDRINISSINQQITSRSITPLSLEHNLQDHIHFQNQPNNSATDQSQIDIERPYSSTSSERQSEVSEVSEVSKLSEVSKVSKSISRILLSKNIFQNAKKVNTVFYSLSRQSTEKDSELGQSRRKSIKQEKSKYVNQLEKLFQVPEQEDYTEFLKKYKPIDRLFKIKSLISKHNFQIVQYDNGVYFGQIQRDQRQGLGLLISEKYIFEGKFENGSKKYGYEKNSDGIYKGEYSNNLREGKGTFNWNNGEFFEGSWKKGMKEGFGIWKSPHGDCYEGEWKHNAQQGQGKYKFKTSVYEGNFVNFLKQGHGIETFLNGDKYEGSYRNGKPHGNGKYIWSQGSYYEGQFVDGFREGKGFLFESQLHTYEGSFKKDHKHGRGKETYGDGQYFEGDFVQGNKVKGFIVDKNMNSIEITNS